MKRLRSLILAAVALGFVAFALVGRPADATGGKMAAAAKTYLTSLTADQQQKGTFPFDDKHRLAWFLVKGSVPKQIDHEDTDKLNNRFRNLRPCTCKGNAGNANIHRHNTSGYRGVSLNAQSGFYHAQIKVYGKQTYLGRSRDPREAARIYDVAAKAHFGAFARLNNA